MLKYSIIVIGSGVLLVALFRLVCWFLRGLAGAVAEAEFGASRNGDDSRDQQ